jgi:acetoin utilization deacetylase AcuC-like enzyme
MTLEVEDFAELGRWLHQADFPVAGMLEGGYSAELPQLLDAFLSAWASP